MTASRQLSLLTLAAILVVVGISYLAESHPISANIAKINTTGDSLSKTRPSFQANLAQSQKERDVSEAAQLASAKRESNSRVRADAEKRRADSLASLALASDSNSALWRAAYVARDSEAAELRIQITEAHAQRDSALGDKASIGRDLSAALDRNAALEKFAADLRVALTKATECKIIWKIRCPSRMETAGGVLVLDGLLHVARR